MLTLAKGAWRCSLLLLLAACASTPGNRLPEWSHPARDPSEWKAEMVDCERFFGGSDTDKARCMTAKGWRRNR